MYTYPSISQTLVILLSRERLPLIPLANSGLISNDCVCVCMSNVSSEIDDTSQFFLRVKFNNVSF